MLNDDMLAKAASLLDVLRAHGLTVATAESCTGGLVAAALTAIPGSSDCVLAGLVTYANTAKVRLLGVPEGVLEEDGAVSEACARHMAEGAVRVAGSHIGIATTGIAGPGGGTAEKPVGLVFIAAARDGHPTTVERLLLSGDRGDIRAQTVLAAFRLLERAGVTPAARPPHLALS